MGAHDAPREHRRGTITLAVTSTAILGTLGAGSFVAATSSSPAPTADDLAGTPATWQPAGSDHPAPFAHPHPVMPPASAVATYTVQDGDVLSAIAERFHIAGGWQALWAANTSVVANPNQLRRGMILRLTGIALSPALSARLRALLAPAVSSGSTGSQTSPATSGGQPPVPVLSPGSYQAYALSLFPEYGWGSSEMGCLDPLWNEESGWNPLARNASGATGIPQALPGDKMASAGPDWETDGDTQIRWGEGYIKGTYGTPCAAWDHEQADGWY